ncbi:MAG: hypothetical protein ACRDRI_18060 [Pseudonocardiaceae bacterium]
MSGDPAIVPDTREGHLRGAPRWGVSSADWRAHAVDEDADHPHGVYVARCGHQLRGAATLYDEAPDWMCLSCLRWTDR